MLSIVLNKAIEYKLVNANGYHINPPFRERLKTGIENKKEKQKRKGKRRRIRYLIWE